MIRRLLLAAAGAFGLLAVAIVALLLALQPPRVAVAPQADYVIADVTVYNPGAEPIPAQTIEVRGGRITAIRPRAPGDPEPTCRGCVAMPGLIDAHVHTPPRVVIGHQKLFALMYLAYGVTSVRDTGQSEPSVAALARDLNAGRIAGPHLYRCGPVLDGDPPAWPIATVVRTSNEGARAVARLADDGVDCIKVYNTMSAEVFVAVAAAAAERDTPLIGHVPHHMSFRDLYDFEVQHATGVPYLEIEPPYGKADYRDEDLLAMTDAALGEVLDLAEAHRVSFTPTLANHDLRLTSSDPTRFPPTDGAAHLPAFWERAWPLVAGRPGTPEAVDLHIRARAPFRGYVRDAHARGLDVLAGTDTLMPWVVPGEALHLEIAALAETFDDADAALAAATVVNARHIDAGEIGVLAPGARADILLLPGDPRADLAVLRDWRFVMVDGRLYDRASIDAALDRYDRHFHGALYGGVMDTLVDFAIGGYAHN